MALRLDGVTVRLGAHVALDDVTATLPPGQVTAILGPNGAGKSTLLRAVAGLIAPASGAVSFDGRPVAAIDGSERARLIGYLPQDGAVHWNLTTRDLVGLGRLPHRATAAEDDAAIARALALTDAAGFADRPVFTLSGGERARVLLARVLAGEPRWLLADEPLASLDPAHALDMAERLHDAAAAGAGVVLVAHDLLHAQRIADNALLLAHGRLVAFGPTREVVTPYNLARTFGVRVSAVAVGDRSYWIPTGRA